MTETRCVDPARTKGCPSSTRTPTLAQRAACALAISLSLFFLADCRAIRSKADDKNSGFPRAETFYIGGWKWGEPATFNPLSRPDWPVAKMNLIYETLLMYNSITGQMEPLLAESYAVHGALVEVTLNAAARWNDGKPVTGWDVSYTFELGKRYKSLDIAPIWQYLDAVRVYGEDGQEAKPSSFGDQYPRRVVFELNPEKRNPLVVLDALQAQRILPRHVIEPMLAQRGGSLEELQKLKFDKDVVSSGPYKLLSYSSEKIATIRDDGYWGNQALHGGKKPIVKYLVHPIYKSNDAFSVALGQGRLDISCAFVPRIWLKAKKGVRSWLDREPYFLSSSIPMLLANHKRAPLMDVHLRRAIAYAINYKDIRELAVSGYSEPLEPGLILPFGLERQFFSEADVKKYGTWFDPEKAKAELRAGGYTSVFGADGKLIETRDRNAEKVPTVYVKSPTGWSDWESIVRIAVKSMRAVGIDARERFVDTSLFWNALYEGDFDLIMHTPSTQPSPSKPWSRFEALLTTRDFAPLGQKMYKNMGRFNDPHANGYLPRIDELLALIPTLTDEAARLSAYRELNVLFMQEQPDFPLVYRPDTFYEFSSKHWSNMPSAANPYLPPLTPGDRLGTNMLWAIQPVLN
ncbi:MAG: ABC transporter substrate-binding protein [Pseudomonadota bacterium]